MAASFHLPLSERGIIKSTQRPARVARWIVGCRIRLTVMALGCCLVAPQVRAGGVLEEVRSASVVDAAALLESALGSETAEALERLFTAGVEVETRFPDGDTPLLAAVRRLRPDLVAACLDWCARTEAVCSEGATALTLAVVSGHDEVVRRLVEVGADANHALPAPAPTVVQEAFEPGWFRNQLRHDPGLTPLMLAAVMGHESMVQSMLDHGGKVHQRTRRYTTDAVVLACRAGQIRIGQRLLRRDPDAPDNQEVVVRLGDQRATLFRGTEAVLTSKVSTGRKSHPTPTGEFLITSKHRDWTSTIYKSPMPYLLRLNGSDIGLHQGVLPGYPASHGCIRLPRTQAAAFFKTARIGDRVLIRP